MTVNELDQFAIARNTGLEDAARWHDKRASESKKHKHVAWHKESAATIRAMKTEGSKHATGI